jgi:iron(III) transport system permease protein
MRTPLLIFIWTFFAVFLFYPVIYVLQGAFFVPDERGGFYFTLEYFRLLFSNELYVRSFANSFIIAVATTVASLAITLPLAVAFTRYAFPAKGFLQAAMLLPLILPPFVGAIGIKHFFARFGTINILLAQMGLISIENPIDWFGGGGLWGIILMETLHSFPIMFLSVSAALANIDPSMRDAANNLGARGLHVFRTITLPLAMPGIFAGSSLVFVSAFTDLGTPLIFDFSATVPTQIFNASGESGVNPIGYALVLATLVLVVVTFLVAKRYGDAGSYAMMGRAATHGGDRALPGWKGWMVTGGVALLLLVALLPHLGVVLSSIAKQWFMTALPTAVTFEFYGEIFTDELTRTSIKNSLIYASASAIVDVILGVVIAQLLARETFRGKAALDAAAMIPLALPGLVLAFGYVMSFNFVPGKLFGMDSDTPWVGPLVGVLSEALAAINPRNNPTFLLIMSYAVRRLPYIVRAAYAGYQQTSVALEEASYNLGAGRWRTLSKITLPLIAANLVAGTILTFSFAMLEVSDSLILAMEERFAPITRAIYDLMGRPDPDAAALACAMGVLAMVLLGISLLIASKILGQKMGQLFRA